MADVGWTDVTATTAVLTQVLRGLGYEPQTTLLSVPVTFAVMKGGNIVEQGTHAELIAKDGFYADLYNSQFAAPVSA